MADNKIISSWFIPRWYGASFNGSKHPAPTITMINERRGELREEPGFFQELTPVKALSGVIGMAGLLLAGAGVLKCNGPVKILGVGATVLGVIGWFVDKLFVGDVQDPNELTQAISNNDFAKVDELIKKGFDVNKKNDQGFTPLVAEDIADAVVYCTTRPLHVNVAELIVFPQAQASLTDIYREGQPTDRKSVV